MGAGAGADFSALSILLSRHLIRSISEANIFVLSHVQSVCGPHSQPMFALTRAGLIDRIGLENVCGDMDNALARAKEILEARRAHHKHG